ncbi:hypothetical protein ONE63_007091 [Megalurothrips usitatus]|uniref:C-type lectin domain-containing protein n=1 Tax=Megalurothrips usitatus TaxID=439358 RepID=A0AAV7XUD2_9NEOP|nr:hypothetical protein ONE63_007091 [Megalurothrips usitatus]
MRCSSGVLAALAAACAVCVFLLADGVSAAGHLLPAGKENQSPRSGGEISSPRTPRKQGPPPTPPPPVNVLDPIDECSSANCLDEGGAGLLPNRWTMPLLRLGEKRFYLGIFFKANWYRATQYCRYHGMHLASISSQEENDKLEKHIRDYGLGHEHFWTSGTDQAEEGTFFWMATGRPITFTNWNTGEPNNFRYENGEEEHCLELWNRDGKGLKWNDSPCSFETYFVCEV